MEFRFMQKNYFHSGDIGDLIAFLPSIKTIGGGELTLFPSATQGHRMDAKRAASLLPFLECQPYLSKISWQSDYLHEANNVNTDNWRSAWNRGFNLSDIAADWFGIPHYDRHLPWLFVPEVKRLKPIVCSRTFRYRNPKTDACWKRLVDKFRDDIVFLGHAEEYVDFCKKYGNVMYHPTIDFLEVAKVIAGSEIVVSNQTSIYWVATGLKMPVCLEHTGANCHFNREGAHYWNDEKGFVPSSKEEIIEQWYTACGLRGKSNSLLTRDRLRWLAKLVKETEHLDGEMAEFGVFRGGSAATISSISPHKTLHLFDTFSGLPHVEEKYCVHEAGIFAENESKVRDYLHGYNTNFHTGFFPDTTKGLEDVCYSFVHMDADLYQSTIAGIDYFWPRMVSGGRLVFDDWTDIDCPGVAKAILEKFSIKEIHETTKNQAYVVKQ